MEDILDTIDLYLEEGKGRAVAAGAIMAAGIMAATLPDIIQRQLTHKALVYLREKRDNELKRCRSLAKKGKDKEKCVKESEKRFFLSKINAYKIAKGKCNKSKNPKSCRGYYESKIKAMQISSKLSWL
jgi:hypothetical protein